MTTIVLLLLLLIIHIGLSRQGCGHRPLFSSGCGHRPITGYRRVKRVVSGSEAVPNSWPWQVLIERKGKGPDGGFGQHCGGTLIRRQWVVTAAHCLFTIPDDPSQYRVILGAHDWSKNESTTQTFEIEKMVINRRVFSDKAYGYDIALIKLSRPAVLNSAVGLACLPKQDDRVLVGTMCYITGWGRLHYTSPKSTTLQQAALPVVSYTTCQEGNSWFLPVDEFSMLCAGYGGESKVSGCGGDSGGPFVCKENGKWVVRGAVSWGVPKCPGGTTYSVFARISSFIYWMKMHMGEKPVPERCELAGMTHPDLGNLCADNHYWCSRWKAENKCEAYFYKASLKKYCPLSCGYCSIDISVRSLDAMTNRILNDHDLPDS